MELIKVIQRYWAGHKVRIGIARHIWLSGIAFGVLVVYMVLTR
jgi:hypothetical protein